MHVYVGRELEVAQQLLANNSTQNAYDVVEKGQDCRWNWESRSAGRRRSFRRVPVDLLKLSSERMRRGPAEARLRSECLHFKGCGRKCGILGEPTLLAEC